MNNSILNNIKRIPLEIAFLLAKNNNLQELLVSDDNEINKPDFHPLTINELLSQNYICLSPFSENGIKDNSCNTRIIIQIDEIDFANYNDNLSVDGYLFIATDKNHALLKNNNLRTLEILDCVYNILNNKKISSAGNIELTSAINIDYDEFIKGFKVRFHINDQTTVRKAEI